jgi:glycosyltransferase involved in cell wall biosynthesis
VPLRMVAYTGDKDSLLADSLARCINERTREMCRCVWGSTDGRSAILFDGDRKWTAAARAADEELASADLIVQCDAPIAPHHRSLVAAKPMVRLTPGRPGSDATFFRIDVARSAFGELESPDLTTTPNLVPFPLPSWDEDYAALRQDSVVRVLLAGGDRVENAPGRLNVAHRISAMLERLQASCPVEMEVIDARQGELDHRGGARQAHIVIDDCSPGGGGAYSLAGLAWGCVVINGLGSCCSSRETFGSLTAFQGELPFLCASPETLESLLDCLIRSGAKSLVEAGERNRRWAESEWDFARQWSSFWTPTIAGAMEQHVSSVASLQPAGEPAPSSLPQRSISVVIVTRDEGAYLRRTVHSLRASLSYHDEIIVVDDQSSDRSTQGLEETYNQVRVLRPDRRLGVAGARNYGAQHATGDIIVFSDAHIEVPNDWAAPILDALSIDQAGAATTGLDSLRLRTGKGVCGGRWRPGTADYLRWEWLGCSPADPYPIPLLTGGFLAMRRAVFDSIGGFDSGMFMYGVEDAELSVRLWTMGYQCLAVPRVLVAHRFDDPNGKAGCDYKHSEIRIHNKLRLAVLHFCAQRIARVVEHFASNPKFPAAFARLAEGDAWTRRRELHAIRQHDDDWYFQRFSIPL